MALTRRQRNGLFETLVEKGIDPADCELNAPIMKVQSGFFSKLTWTSFRDGARIAHRPTGSDFRFEKISDGCLVGWKVVDGRDNGPIGTPCPTWADMLTQLRTWAEEVKYVNDTPDLWAELQQVPRILSKVQAADASNAPFTPDEQAEIARLLDEIKNLVREQFELTDEQLATIDQRLDEANEEAKHQGRKTWLYTFYGAVMSTFMTDAVPPHVIQTVLSTVVHGIAQIFGFGGPPPIIST